MSPSTIFTVARHEFLATLRRRSVQFVIFGLPLLFVLGTTVLNLAVGRQGATAGAEIAESFIRNTVSEEQTPVGVVDETGELTPELLDAVSESRRVPLFHFADREVAMAALEQEAIRGFYVVPADYMETRDVQLFAENQSLVDSTEGGLYRALIAAALATDDPSTAVGIANRAANPVGNLTVRDLSVTEETNGARPAAFGLGFAVAILFFMTVVSSSNYLMQSLGVEKQNRVMEVLLSSMRPLELLIGKMVGLGAVGLLQIAVWGLLALPLILLGLVGAAYGVAVGAIAISPRVILLTVLHFATGYLVYASLFAALGAVAPSPKESSQYTFFFLLPAFLPLWFGWFFLEEPDATFATVLSLIPMTAPIAMPMRLVVTDVPGWQLLLSLSISLATALLTLWLATRVFRRSGALLSSQDFSWGRLWSAVRG